MAAGAAAAGFMLWAAGHFTIFDDEAFSCQRYVLPVCELLDNLRRGVEPDPPLYYLSIHGWISLFGVRPVALRSLSIVYFLLGLFALRAAARRWYGPNAARWAVVLAALHPLHLFFGFAARWYSLMFLCTALLLWFSGPPLDDERGAGRARRAGWTAAAAAALYTNYFAPCVVGLLWLWVVWRDRRDRRAVAGWLLAGGAAGLLYLPWMSVFYGELTRFPRVAAGWFAYAASAARTGVALAAGNLADPGGLSRADPGAWWVWAPLCGCGLLMTALAALQWPRHTGLLWLCGGCVAAGVGTLTMIDKYVMTFSGSAALLVAGVLTRERAARGAGAPGGVEAAINAPARRAPASGRRPGPARAIAAVLLAIGWFGCYVNLADSAYWTSLRWSDPFAAVVDDVAARWKPGDALAATHPSVRYYWGLAQMPSAAQSNSATQAERWRAAAETVAAPGSDRFDAALATADRIWLIETAATGSDADAVLAAKSRLEAAFALADRATFAPDPHARRKNRIDPAYYHPVHRIVRYCYERKPAGR